MSADKCPHCGAERRDLYPNRVSWTCNSYSYDRNTVYRSQLCEERAARQNAEAQVVNLTTENEILAMSVTTLKAQLENLKSSNASSGLHQSHYEGDTNDEYHRGFHGHGY